MKENFEQCLTMLLGHEGGYVDHPDDPGGATNWGVTKTVWEKWVGHEVSKDDIKSLTKEDVAPVYKKNYWDRVCGDDLPSGVDWSVFDWAVNSGTGRAAKALQAYIGAAPDGSIGPNTLRILKQFESAKVIHAMHDARQAFYEGLSHFKTFGKGWTRRNQETRDTALEMAS